MDENEKLDDLPYMVVVERQGALSRSSQKVTCCPDAK
jgi:hypothetical protein